MTTAPVRVAVLGCSNVGAALVQLLTEQADDIAERTGVRLELVRVAVRDLTKERPIKVADGVLTDDTAAVVDELAQALGGLLRHPRSRGHSATSVVASRRECPSAT